ncbi:MAG: hypothetical protein D3923_07045 [Candidatus Electrothrix sp. AR3]|nr:hypothetical protein [Candidatus Electrothrix sp. AR3]
MEKAKQELDILKLPEQERLAYGSKMTSITKPACWILHRRHEEEGTSRRKERDIEIACNLLAASLLDNQTVAEMTGRKSKHCDRNSLITQDEERVTRILMYSTLWIGCDYNTCQ